MCTGLSNWVSAILPLLLLDLIYEPPEEHLCGFLCGLREVLVGDSVGGVLLGYFRGDSAENLAGDFGGE